MKLNEKSLENLRLMRTSKPDIYVEGDNLSACLKEHHNSYVIKLLKNQKVRRFKLSGDDILILYDLLQSLLECIDDIEEEEEEGEFILLSDGQGDILLDRSLSSFEDPSIM